MDEDSTKSIFPQLFLFKYCMVSIRFAMLKTCGQLLASLLLWHGLWTILDDLEVLLHLDQWIGYRGLLCTSMGVIVLVLLHYCCMAANAIDEVSNSTSLSSGSAEQNSVIAKSAKDCSTTSIKEMLDEIV